MERDGWRVYTDGSDVDGGVGAAAVCKGEAKSASMTWAGRSADNCAE